MAIFISYSHEDAQFVDQLAMHLVAARASVWVDRWELHVGDSLRQKIEAAMVQASAVIFVLSPSSVASDWCQRELSAGLVRELEERRVIVLPVLIKDCAVPLFLKDKMYADFRSDFDKGLQQVQEALARVTSLSLGRLDEAEGHIDWSTRWGMDSVSRVIMSITLIQQGGKNPYTILTTAVVTLNDPASRRHLELAVAGAESVGRQLVLEMLAEVPDVQDLRILLEDADPVSREITIHDNKIGVEFQIEATSQRLGEDTGRDILVPVGAQLSGLAVQTRGRMLPLQDEERKQAMEILRRYRPTLPTS